MIMTMIVKITYSDIQLIRQKKPSSAVGVLEPVLLEFKAKTYNSQNALLLANRWSWRPTVSRHALSLAVPQLQTSVRVTSIPKSLYLICAPSEYDQTNECPQRGKGRGFLYATKATDREPLSLTDLPSWRRRNVIGQFQMDKRNEG